MFAALLGPALSFGSSLISGLGARQSAKKQQKMQAAYEYQNYLMRENYNAQRAAAGLVIQNDADDFAVKWDPRNIARDADRVGFNPVTFANAFGGFYGAAQQQAQAQRVAGIEMQVNESYYQNAPTAQVPSAMEAVGGALQSGVNTFLSDRRVSQSQDFQREMLQTQISAIQRNGGRPTSGMGVPVSQRTFFGSGQLPYAVSAGTAVGRRPETAPGTWDPKNDETKYVNPFGGLTTPDGTVIGRSTGYNRFPSVDAIAGVTGDEGWLPIIYGGANSANYAWWQVTGRDFDTSLWVTGRQAGRARALTNGTYDQFTDRGFHQYGYTTGGGF